MTYDHVALYYGDDDELSAAGASFLADGLDRGEAVVVALDPSRVDLVLAGVDSSAVTILPGDAHYTRPAVAIRSYCDLFTRLVAGGSTAVRVLGEVPASPIGWDVWSRYESAVNYAYDRFPVRCMCVYDTRTTSAGVLEDVARTHSVVAATGGTFVANPDYVEPLSFLAHTRPMTPHAIQHEPPVVDLVDPSPAAARNAVVAANGNALSPGELEDLVVSVSEVVTNAVRYGVGPVRLRVWSRDHHMVVTVHDRGRGPADPFAGLVADPAPGGGGYGLWLVHQLCHHVTLATDDTGFTVRLSMWEPRAT
ncbi:sensor histidine kinase [Actinokineospora inagensis]|uniref:sensor histidine kinase n=1 Tax=Actinokineospora inagensis TaxID=103730 RepID=UPI000426DBD4|nr:sensor histidine kinase [Actinokineospora inagensis]